MAIRIIEDSIMRAHIHELEIRLKRASKLRKRIGILDTEKKRNASQETHRNYMLQMQTLINQKSIEALGDNTDGGNSGNLIINSKTAFWVATDTCNLQHIFIASVSSFLPDHPVSTHFFNIRALREVLDELIKNNLAIRPLVLSFVLQVHLVFCSNMGSKKD